MKAYHHSKVASSRTWTRNQDTQDGQNQDNQTTPQMSHRSGTAWRDRLAIAEEMNLE